jgi:plastocyanin
MRRLGLVVLLLVFLVSCAREDRARVELTGDRQYEPREITIRTGETVTWSHESSEAHSVTAYQSSIRKGMDYFSSSGHGSEEEARADVGTLMTTGDTFSVRFDRPGTFRYFCIPHEDQGMRGTIVVEG